ncbi:hypothetical protein N9N67_00085 [Bacteriovoracaceae bacterium]|nr:hypothetical protein [Bacteriovoracaceae bacterium]
MQKFNLFFSFLLISSFNIFSQDLLGTLNVKKAGYNDIAIEVHSGKKEEGVIPGGAVYSYENRALKIYRADSKNKTQVVLSVKDLKGIHSLLANEGALVGGITIATIVWSSRWAAQARIHPAASSRSYNFFGINIPRPTYFNLGRFGMTYTWGVNNTAWNAVICVASCALEYFVDDTVATVFTEIDSEQEVFGFSELLENYTSEDVFTYGIKFGEWINPLPEINKAAVLGNLIDNILKANFDNPNQVNTINVDGPALSGSLENFGIDNDRYTVLDELINEVERFGYEYIK